MRRGAHSLPEHQWWRWPRVLKATGGSSRFDERILHVRFELRSLLQPAAQFDTARQGR
jgi:hypothetical protein